MLVKELLLAIIANSWVMPELVIGIVLMYFGITEEKSLMNFLFLLGLNMFIAGLTFVLFFERNKNKIYSNTVLSLKQENYLKYLIITSLILQFFVFITQVRDHFIGVTSNFLPYFLLGLIQLTYCYDFYIKQKKSIVFRNSKNVLHDYMTEDDIVKGKRRICYYLLIPHILMGTLLLVKRYFS